MSYSSLKNIIVVVLQSKQKWCLIIRANVRSVLISSIAYGVIILKLTHLHIYFTLKLIASTYKNECFVDVLSKKTGVGF